MGKKRRSYQDILHKENRTIVFHPMLVTALLMDDGFQSGIHFQTRYRKVCHLGSYKLV